MSINIAAISIDSRTSSELTAGMPTKQLPSKRLLEALDELERAAAENAQRSREVGERAALMRTKMLDGASAHTLIEQEDRPRMVELLSSNMEVLKTAGTEFRVAQAEALRAEGATIEAIGELFGVTRQRISALLRQRPA